MIKRFAAATALLYAAFLIVSLIVGTVSLAQQPYRRGYPGMGPLANRPPCGTTTDMYLATDTSALYSCNNSVWTEVSGGSGGSGGDYGLDCTPYVGADLGATLNACIAAAVTAGQGVANISKLAPVQTLSTTVDDTSAVSIFTCGQIITQSAKIVLDSQGVSFYGCPEIVTTMEKSGNLAEQVDITSEKDSVLNIDFEGGASQGVNTGAAIQIENTSLYTIIERNVTEFEDECINDLGGQFTVTSGNVCNSWNVNGYAVAGVMTSTDFLTSGTAVAGSAINATGSDVILWLNGVHVSDGGTVAAINEDITDGALVVQNGSTIDQTNGYPAIIASGINANLDVFGSTVVGGGTHGNVVEQTGGLVSGFFVNISDNTNLQNTISGGDVLDLSGINIIVSNNSMIVLSNSAGASAIHITGESAGALIENNRIQFQTGGTPTGNNYGIELGGSGGTIIMGDNQVKNNLILGQSTMYDVGIFYDTSANTGSGDNDISGNHCGQVQTCILSSPFAGEVNYYTDNHAQSGTLYSGQLATELVAETAPVVNCGTTTTCSPVTTLLGRIVYGTVSLSGGSATIGSVPIGTSVVCTATDKTAANPVKISSFVITGTGSDVIQYLCIGTP